MGDVVDQLLDDDVGGVVSERVVIAQLRSSLANLRDAVKLTTAEVLDVVDHVVGEQCLQPIEVATIEQMTMESDQLLDGDAVLSAVAGSGSPDGDRSLSSTDSSCTGWPMPNRLPSRSRNQAARSPRPPLLG